MRIDSYTKDIAAAATAESLVADAATGFPQFKYARSIIIRCPSGNTSDLLLGSRQRQNTLIPKGTALTLQEVNRAGQSGKYELDEIYVKAGTNGDDVEITIVDGSDA